MVGHLPRLVVGHGPANHLTRFHLRIFVIVAFGVTCHLLLDQRLEHARHGILVRFDVRSIDERSHSPSGSPRVALKLVSELVRRRRVLRCGLYPFLVSAKRQANQDTAVQQSNDAENFGL